MPLYLSPYVGSGVHGDPFRPAGLDQPGASAVDIRLDPTVADGSGIGFALLWLPVGSIDPIGSTKLADDYGDRLTNRQRNRLNTRLGLDFVADATIQDAMETIMLRPDFAKWKRLRPSRGIYELWLGSGTGKRDWIRLPAIAGGALSDSFTRANETPIASPWVELASSTGDINLSSNAITKSSNGDYFAYYSNGAGWNADQSSQFTITTLGSGDFGPAVRVGSNGFSGYFYSNYTVSGFRGPAKFVAGTFTSIETGYTQATGGQTIKIDAAGSTIRCYANGSEDALSPATDTSLSTAGNGAGVFWYESGDALDDWTGTGEITASGPAGPLIGGDLVGAGVTFGRLVQ